VIGTFSNLEYNEESGDLLGLEVKIVPALHAGLQAAILESEGEPGPISVVNVHASECAVAFSFSSANGTSWTFEGYVSMSGLDGTITYTSGTREKVILRRGCGYWDR
jgi:hypothetical protein